MESSVFHERVKRLKEVNEVIEKLDPAIREGAFSLLAGYITGQPHTTDSKQKAGAAGGEAEESTLQMTELFGRFPDGKPSQNALLIAAWFYSQ